jgi:glycosyltransferase involved in cell wall biosynthesis
MASISIQRITEHDPPASVTVSSVDEASACTVDVVIPCYNYARYLTNCVHSVLSQSGVHVRILIIDDASTDDTELIGRELAQANAAVEFRRHTINKGHIATYNEGLIEWTISDYVVLLSADDLLTPGSLQRATQVMESDSTIGMVYGQAIHFSHGSELRTTPQSKLSYTKYQGLKWLEGRFRSGCNVITSPEVVVRGSVQRSIGGYRPELPHSGDLEMWLRIASVSNIGYIYNNPQAFYRVHDASMQRTTYKSRLIDFVQRKAAFDHYLQHAESRSKDSDKLTDLANRALAREALWDACRAYDRNQVDEVRIRELVEFALSAYARAEFLSEYAAFLRRRSLGPVICNRTQIFFAPAAIRWVNRKLRKRRWERHGI